MAKSKKDQKSSTIDEGFDNGQFFEFPLQELRKQKKKACIGYLSMNVVNPPDGAIWGKFNNRALNHAWIQSMSETFVKHRDCCSDDYSMDVTLDPDWLVDRNMLLPTVEGLMIEDVPVMDFSAEGKLKIKDDNLWMLGGNHRRLALKKYIDTMKAEVIQTNGAIERVTRGKNDAEIQGMNPERLSMVRDGQEAVKRLEEKIASSCMWVVRVYDRGACLDSLYRDSVADEMSIQPKS